MVEYSQKIGMPVIKFILIEYFVKEYLEVCVNIKRTPKEKWEDRCSIQQGFKKLNICIRAREVVAKDHLNILSIRKLDLIKKIQH